MRDDLELHLCEVCEEREIEHTCGFCFRETCDECGAYRSLGEGEGAWLCEDCLEEENEKENR